MAPTNNPKVSAMFGLEDVQTARSCATLDFYCE